jgi:hypothetical protein
MRAPSVMACRQLCDRYSYYYDVAEGSVTEEFVLREFVSLRACWVLTNSPTDQLLEERVKLW